MDLKSFSVKFGLPFGLGDVQGTWAPDESEQKAAWEMYVELITRVSVVQLREGEGLLREALTSLHALFGVTRGILKQYGPAVASPRKGETMSFGGLAVTVLNSALRPLLAKWHPLLEEYELSRPQEISRRQWEADWERSAELRSELEQVRQTLVGYARILGEVSGAEDLITSGAAKSDES